MLRFELLIVAACLSSVFGISSFSLGGRWGGLVISRRDASAASTESNLSEMVNMLLDSAKQGIDLSDLGEAAQDIQAEADKQVDAMGLEVPADDIKDVINSAAADEMTSTVAVSALFDNPIIYDDVKMKAALSILDKLNQKVAEQSAAGESTHATLAAISMTAQTMQATVLDVAGRIIYTSSTEQDQAEDGDRPVNKRWEVNAGVNYNPRGGYSYGVGVSHSWKRKRAINKRWEVNAGVNYNPMGGYSYGVGVSHSWKRKRAVGGGI